MNSGTLDKDSISQPELWKLALTVSRSRMDVALFPPVTRQEMIWRSYSFNPSAADQLKAIEDIIYDNPLLFSDFKQVDCIIDNTPQLLLPSELTEEQIAMCYDRTTAQTAVSDADIETFPTGDDTCFIALRQNPQLRAFFTRTFYNVRFDSRVAALCRYFTAHRDENADNAELDIIMRDGHLTLIVTDSQRILMANTFSYIKEIDAAYYVMASLNTLQLDPENTTVRITPATADEEGSAHNILRRFIPDIKPVPFPMLRYRASRPTLQAPFELITRPLCE